MSATISIPITDSARRALNGLDPQHIRTSVARAMDAENQLTIAHISEARLSGKGPFPVEEHRLGVRSRTLVRSLRASKAVVSADQITSAIGTNVVYAGIHEFGGVISHAARAGRVRLRTDASGNLLRRGANGRLATFAKSSHKRAVERTFTTSGHDVTMPARAPIFHGIQDRRENYGAAISGGITSALNGGAA